MGLIETPWHSGFRSTMGGNGRTESVERDSPNPFGRSSRHQVSMAQHGTAWDNMRRGRTTWHSMGQRAAGHQVGRLAQHGTWTDNMGRDAGRMRVAAAGRQGVRVAPGPSWAIGLPGGARSAILESFQKFFRKCSGVRNCITLKRSNVAKTPF